MRRDDGVERLLEFTGERHTLEPFVSARGSMSTAIPMNALEQRRGVVFGRQFTRDHIREALGRHEPRIANGQSVAQSLEQGDSTATPLR